MNFEIDLVGVRSIRLGTDMDVLDALTTASLLLEVTGRAIELKTQNLPRLLTPVISASLLHVGYLARDRMATLEGVHNYLTSGTDRSVLMQMLDARHDMFDQYAWTDFYCRPTRTHPFVRMSAHAVLAYDEAHRHEYMDAARQHLAVAI